MEEGTLRQEDSRLCVDVLFWSPVSAGNGSYSFSTLSLHGGASKVFMIVYVWGREFPNNRLNIHGLLELKGFYLPWYMLGIDLILGNPLKPDLLGIAAGHLFYFSTVIYPLASGKNYCKTPYRVHKPVAFWGEGFQINAPVRKDDSARVAVSGRSYRLDGSRSKRKQAAQHDQIQQQQEFSKGGAIV